MKYTFAGAILSGIFFGWTGCRSETGKEPAGEPELHVRVAPAEIREISAPVMSTGMLGTNTQVKLSFKTGGLIREIHVREGERVRKDQVLAGLDLSEISAQVRQSRIGLEKAERDLTRARNLYEDSVATLEQYQNARSAYELARSQQQIAEFNLRHSRIKAPSTGKIEKILAEDGEMIAPGHPVILFGSTENDWVVRVSLADREVVKLSMEDSATVTMDAFPGMDFKASVWELGSVADPVTGTYEVELRIHKELPGFRTGFISRVRIYPGEQSPSLVVPVESLLDASDWSARVYVYGEGVARSRRIRTGTIYGEVVEVREGLREGELVITEGARFLRRDMEVKAMNLPETGVQ